MNFGGQSHSACSKDTSCTRDFILFFKDLFILERERECKRWEELRKRERENLKQTPH